MFEPVRIVAFLIIEPKVRAPLSVRASAPWIVASAAIEQEAKFDGLDQLSIEVLAFILQLHRLIRILQSIDSIEGMAQAFVRPLNEDIVIHLILHLTANPRRRLTAG